MNNIAISPYIALHALQIQNIKRNVAKKIKIEAISKEQNPVDPSPKEIIPIELIPTTDDNKPIEQINISE
jgi:hypothetical protein